MCHFISEGDHAGLRLEQMGRCVFEILPDRGLVIDSSLNWGEKPIADGVWQGNNFSYRLNLKRKPFYFEFVASRMHLRSGETIDLVAGLSFESADFSSLSNRLRGLVTGNTQAKETEIREIVNPYVRLLE